MNSHLLGLFFSAFISSTLFPGGSEALLAYLYVQYPERYWSLLAVASLGNTLGAMTSWGIGRLLAWRFPLYVHNERRQKAIDRLGRYGSPVLLLSWLPVVGDPLCVAAGWLRMHWLKSLIFIGLGKTLRYLFLLELTKYSL
jgi:membrane protein YqaA with SNARE-associated domain